MADTELLLIFPHLVKGTTPVGESLSSYLQRLASLNCLSIPSILALMATDIHLPLPKHLTSRFLQTVDTHLSFVSSPLFMTHTPWHVVTRLSLSRLFTMFYGSLTSGETAIHTFFSAPYGKRSIEATRRWCPLCLITGERYHSLWQFTDVTVCVTHGCMLRTVCAACDRPVSVLHVNSVFGHCEHCYAYLGAQPTLPARQQLLMLQQELQGDYAALLSGRLVLSGRACYPNWKRSLTYLREQEHLTKEELAHHLCLSPSTILLLECESAIVSLHVILRAARHLAGSLTTLSQTSVPPDWYPHSGRRWVSFAKSTAKSSAIHDPRIVKRIIAAIQKLTRTPHKLTIKRLAETTAIKQRKLESVLRDNQGLQHRLKASKAVNGRLLLRHRLNTLLARQQFLRESQQVTGGTVESVCRLIGTSKDRLRKLDTHLYSALKTHLHAARVSSAIRHEQFLIRQLRALMSLRATLGLPCSRRAVAHDLKCDFKNYPRVYAIWKELRGL